MFSSTLLWVGLGLLLLVVSIVLYNTPQVKAARARRAEEYRRQEEKRKEEAISDDPVKRLTNKFIDGEITEEEYEKKMTIIKKHYPR